ncbi:flagellar hook assembly protein FlgD [Robertmurraya korlensis]|uniref:flagellar hook assembly protein FlgD n=1 Tax=Robertmurraya korlensis TaxID=519977 RepID=UPI00203E853C|nr:flagellar hook assembly protein FlgD [Robertmurraya korlensis]MCM3600185.1 flagellar hook assembly protein FlgD [Robertmurraya korlensis]
MANTINSSLLLSNYQATQRKTGSDTLGKDDFLKILMTQLQNQDPLNPMQDKDFIAQMATFTSLEQMTNMNKSITSLVSAQEQSQLISYSQFIGKEVSWHKLTESKDGSSVIEQGTGKIASLKFTDGVATFLLEDGTSLTSGNISQINDTKGDTMLLQASMMIGKMVTYSSENNEVKQAKVTSVSFKDGKSLFQLENGESVSSTSITKIEA